MTNNRSGEKSSSPYRSARYFFLDHHWYATTREGITLGPYHLLEECKKMVESFVTFINNADEPVRERYLKQMQAKQERLPVPVA